MQRDCVLVVGATPDYIDMLRKAAPARLLFLTAHEHRRHAREVSPLPVEEVLCDLSAPEVAIMQLKRHIRSYDLHVAGMACFDCDSMEAAAKVGEALGLAYPSVDSIRACRDKSLSKALWREKGVPCPRSEQVASPVQALEVFRAMGTSCVIKPLDGSGSERVFHCKTEDQVKTAYETLRANQYSPVALMETFASGVEYSCDFMIENDAVQVVRITRKIPAPVAFFGTIMAYELIECLPGNVSMNYFTKLLGRAAQALGIRRALCMVDFIVDEDDQVCFLEMAPRPGGDCLPWLIRNAMGLDILKLTVDFAKGGIRVFHTPQRVSPCVGLRIHASKQGILKGMDVSRISGDARVREIMEKQRPGHRIILPPENYDAWNLGHIIFKPSGFSTCEAQCRDLLSRIVIDIKQEAHHAHDRSVPKGSGRPRPKKRPAA